MNALAEKLALAKAQDRTETSFPHKFEHAETVELPAFPVEVLPEKLRAFVVEGAAALNVAVDMIALPLLGFAGGTIGNTIALAIKANWIERANPWIGVIAPPGAGKSPAQQYAQKPVDFLQSKAIEAYQTALDKWMAEVETIKADKTNREPLPEEPTFEHYFTTDATIEGLVNVLSGNPGITVTHDELSGFVAAMNAYRKGADRQSYLSLWAGGTLKVDRRGAGTTYVPHPCVSVVGGIQPDLLKDLGESAGRRDGFIERFLLSEPTPVPQKWTEAEVGQATIDGAIAVFQSLRAKRSTTTGAPEPGIIFPTAEAKQAFARWFDDNQRIIEDSSGLATGFYAKYPGQLLRIALILHCLEHPGDLTRKVGVTTINGAIEVVEYFRQHLVVILPRFAAEASTRTAGVEPRVLRILDKRPGEWVNRTDLHKGLGNSVRAPELAAALERLEGDGKVENRTESTGARPREQTRSLRGNEDMKDARGLRAVTAPTSLLAESEDFVV